MTRYVYARDGHVEEFPDDATPEDVHARMLDYWNSRPQPATPPANPVTPAEPVSQLSDDAEWLRRYGMIAGLQGNRAGATWAEGQFSLDPTVQARKAEGAKTGQQAAEMNARRQDAQYAGQKILKSYAQLYDRFMRTPDEILAQALGPRQTKPYKDWIPFVGGMTEPEANAAYSINVGGLNRDKNFVWNTQNLLGHDAKAVVNAMLMNGTKSMNPSDKRQENFESVMTDFMHSALTKEAGTGRGPSLEILNHAKHVIANDFGLTPAQADAIIKHEINQRRLREAQAAAGGQGAEEIPGLHYSSTGKPPPEQDAIGPDGKRVRMMLDPRTNSWIPKP